MNTRLESSCGMSIVKRKCCDFSWVINERETKGRYIVVRAPCGAGESSYVLYRHKFHGLFIAGILRETEGQGRRDSEEILRGAGGKCKVSVPEVWCIIAYRKWKVLFLGLFFCPFSFPPFFYDWLLYINLAVI